MIKKNKIKLVISDESGVLKGGVCVMVYAMISVRFPVGGWNHLVYNADVDHILTEIKFYREQGYVAYLWWG
jgi:hypothetical protein